MKWNYFFLALSTYIACDTAYANVESCHDKANTTIQMRQCNDNIYRHYNKLLNEKYSQLIQRLPSIGKQRLKNAEQAWNTFRKKECAFAGFSAYQGTLEAVLIGSCYNQLTKARLSTLSHYITDYSAR